MNSATRTQFAVFLSSQDGIYGSPSYYSIPSGNSSESFAIGDFNSDGKLDVVVSDGNDAFYEFLNNGNGTLHLQATFLWPVRVDAIAAADFNHDGRIDLAFQSQDDSSVHVLFGNGDGGFSNGPITPVSTLGPLQVGDFDGDGKADLASQNSFYTTDHQILYGDGAGHFQPSPVFIDNVGYFTFDVNGDGKMDLIGAHFDFSTHGNKYYNTLQVLYGNSNRTFTTSQIQLANCTDGSTPLVADLNGDGINDLVVVEAADCKGSAPFTVDILLRNADGSYQPEQALYSSSNVIYANSVLRLNRDSKPDFSATILDSNDSGSTLALFTNTTPGNFPTCAPPNSATGITLCAPTNTTGETTAATFRIGAANQTPGRKMEVWMDGKKLGEELKHAFSYYTFFDGTFNLAAGQHNVTVYSAGWDNLLERQDFPLTVGFK